MGAHAEKHYLSLSMVIGESLIFYNKDPFSVGVILAKELLVCLLAVSTRGLKKVSLQ